MTPTSAPRSLGVPRDDKVFCVFVSSFEHWNLIRHSNFVIRHSLVAPSCKSTVSALCFPHLTPGEALMPDQQPNPKWLDDELARMQPLTGEPLLAGIHGIVQRFAKDGNGEQQV